MPLHLPTTAAVPRQYKPYPDHAYRPTESSVLPPQPSIARSDLPAARPLPLTHSIYAFHHEAYSSEMSDGHPSDILPPPHTPLLPSRNVFHLTRLSLGKSARALFLPAF